MKIECSYYLSNGNTKLGKGFINQNVGKTIEETRLSCNGCSLLDNGNCYAHYNGTVLMGYYSNKRAQANGKDCSLDTALKLGKQKNYKMFRAGNIGDPIKASKPLSTYKKVVGAGLTAIYYTHFWNKSYKTLRRLHKSFKSIAMASCDSIGQAIEAIEQGWNPYIELPEKQLPRAIKALDVLGYKGIRCPNDTHGTQCNKCKMCSKSHPVWTSGKVNFIYVKRI